MKQYIFLSILALTFLFAPDIAQAAAGDKLLSDVTKLLQGSLGTVVGLGVSLFGLWIWLAQQSSWGILILIAGAAVTAFPGIYSGLTTGFKNAFSASGAKGTSAKSSGSSGSYSVPDNF